MTDGVVVKRRGNKFTLTLNKEQANKLAWWIHSVRKLTGDNEFLHFEAELNNWLNLGLLWTGRMPKHDG